MRRFMAVAAALGLVACQPAAPPTAGASPKSAPSQATPTSAGKPLVLDAWRQAAACGLVPVDPIPKGAHPRDVEHDRALRAIAEGKAAFRLLTRGKAQYFCWADHNDGEQTLFAAPPDLKVGDLPVIAWRLTETPTNTDNALVLDAPADVVIAALKARGVWRAREETIRPVVPDRTNPSAVLSADEAKALAMDLVPTEIRRASGVSVATYGARSLLSCQIDTGILC